MHRRQKLTADAILTVFGLTEIQRAPRRAQRCVPIRRDGGRRGAILITRPIFWAEELFCDVVAPGMKSSTPGSLANRYYNTFSFSLYCSLISGIARCLSAVGSITPAQLARAAAGRRGASPAAIPAEWICTGDDIGAGRTCDMVALRIVIGFGTR